MPDYRDTLTEMTVADRGGQVFNLLAYGTAAAPDAAFVAAIAAATAATNGGTVLVPKGTYVVTVPIELANDVSLEIPAGSVIRAGAVMDALIRTPLAAVAANQAIYGGGVLDCDEKAAIGVHLRCVENYTVADLTIHDPTLIHVKIGDAGALTTSYEAKVRGIRAHRNSGVTHAVGSIGLQAVSGSGDNTITDCVFMAETGVKMETANNTLIGVHCWARASNGWMITAFDDSAIGNTYIGCYADTPYTYGFRLRRYNSVLIGCKVYNNNFFGTDNQVIGVFADELDTYFTAIGTQFKGEGVTRRIAKDFDVTAGGDLDNATIIGTQINNVVTNLGNQMLSTTVKSNFFATGNISSDAGVYADTFGSRTGATIAFGGDVNFGGEVRVTDPLTLGNTTVVLEGTGSGVPDLTGTADSSDGLTAITDKGMLILAENDERQSIRFRCSGTGKAGSGGVRFGLFDNSDYIIHRYNDGNGRLRLDFWDFGAGTAANAGEFSPTRTILRGRVEVVGTYDKPFQVSGFRLWEDGSNNFRVKNGSDGSSSTDGNVLQQIVSGTTASRPTPTVVGYQYYDTTLQMPIWWNGSTWKDATGTLA
jgi:hypothetical protein